MYSGLENFVMTTLEVWRFIKFNGLVSEGAFVVVGFTVEEVKEPMLLVKELPPYLLIVLT